MKFKITFYAKAEAWIYDVSDENGVILHKCIIPTSKARATADAILFVERQKGFTSYDDIEMENSPN